MRNRLLLVALALALSACSAAPDKNDLLLKHVPRDEEYAVYSALLNSAQGGSESGGARNLLVIKDRTSPDKVDRRVPDDVFRPRGEPLSPALEAALRDYEVKNRQPRELTEPFALKVDHVLVSEGELDAFFGGDYSRDKWE